MKEQKHISIKNLPEDDKPREKLISHGRQALSDAELLAIIIGSGNTTESAVQLSQRLLFENNNDLSNIAKLSIQELIKFKGIGSAKAANIAASFELGRRRKEIDKREIKKITSSKSAYDYLNVFLSDLLHEEFHLLLLNRANSPIRLIRLSKGGLSATVIDIKLIAKHAIENHASGIILAHNHPSGNIKPSESDIAITNKIKEALKVFEISTLDHIIIGENDYFSFADENIL